MQKLFMVFVTILFDEAEIGKAIVVVLADNSRHAINTAATKLTSEFHLPVGTHFEVNNLDARTPSVGFVIDGEDEGIVVKHALDLDKFVRVQEAHLTEVREQIAYRKAFLAKKAEKLAQREANRNKIQHVERVQRTTDWSKQDSITVGSPNYQPMTPTPKTTVTGNKGNKHGMKGGKARS